MFRKFLKKKLSKIGFIKKYYRILDDIDRIKDINRILCKENVDLRIKIKVIKNEKINVVFVCHRPTVWGALKSVYEELKNDNNFNVYIVAIPNKKEIPGQWLYHEIYESEGAEEFWKEYGCINGYDYETKEWFDLKRLNPDYVFFQQPYNITRCPAYKSSVVSTYAKICYVTYFVFTDAITGSTVTDSCYPVDFLQDVSYVFAQTKREEKYLRKRMAEYNIVGLNIVLTGYPKYDELNKAKKQISSIWNYEEHDGHFRVIWTPRWNTSEGNCHFFKYKDLIMSYCSKNDDIDFVFRPHPQSWSEWETTGEFTKKQREEFCNKYRKSHNMNIDNNKEYFSMFNQSDCLISDTSSMVLEYFVTGKPIIYCYSEGSIDNFARSKGIGRGLYFVEDWDELELILQKLKQGHDPLKYIRDRIISEEFDISNKAAKNILNTIVNDTL